MNYNENIRRLQLREIIEGQCKGSIEEKIDRYLEIEHQGVIGGHYFAKASSECIYLYRDGYFIGSVMMSHSINEAIIKFIAERNNIDRNNEGGKTKSIKELIDYLKNRNIISEKCAEASTSIWKSFRADIHHMNPTVTKIPFQEVARKNLKDLATIEGEIFAHGFKNGALVPRQLKYWDRNTDGTTTTVFLRVE